jgi:hypothetical protein
MTSGGRSQVPPLDVPTNHGRPKGGVRLLAELVAFARLFPFEQADLRIAMPGAPGRRSAHQRELGTRSGERSVVAPPSTAGAAGERNRDRHGHGPGHRIRPERRSALAIVAPVLPAPTMASAHPRAASAPGSRARPSSSHRDPGLVTHLDHLGVDDLDAAGTAAPGSSARIAPRPPEAPRRRAERLRPAPARSGQARSPHRVDAILMKRSSWS